MERPLLLARLLLRLPMLLLLAAHATPLSVAWLRELLGFSVAEGMLQPPPPLEFELRRAC